MELVIHTWKEYLKDDLKGIDWNLLKTYINDLRKFSRNLLADDLIEEDLPRIDDEKFNPGGWVGVYDLGRDIIKVVPDPERLSEDEFDEIRRELIGWLEAIGPASRELFGKYMDTSIFERRLYATFSRHLIGYTEIALSHFIPRNVLFEDYTGRELRGKPVWDKIVPLRAKGSQLLVSRKISFDLRSLSNLLLTRFHAELLRKINRLFEAFGLEKTPKFLEELERYRRYHEKFISESVFSELLEEALEIDFEYPEILEKVRKSTKGVSLEVIDLWEAYIGKKAFLTDFERVFDIALKPLSKIYELWCYKKLCEILKISEDYIRENPNSVPFELNGKVGTLHYNPPRGLSKYSEIMKKQIGVSPGRPDFAIEFDGKITCVMDAKCKTKLDTSDVQRLLSYLLDYVYPRLDRLVAVIFYLSKEQKDPIRSAHVRNCEIYLVSLTPKTYSDDLVEKIEHIVESTTLS
ncbi:hypothetical protein [Archaeoglobus profundus]|uniref:DUF2357 domain-containing protein n=2 Tax=root TaxID=1 RepID=D2RFD0_ARCPA|nr:hypothetical protein [Archaeoglobus profundus]ADB58824.1 hypothetical protein Arcpr_1780 [Archaeoglobus profundus DSM 5631]